MQARKQQKQREYSHYLAAKVYGFQVVKIEGKSAVKVLNVGRKMATSRCPQSQISDQGELATSSAAAEEGHQ